MRNGAMFKKKGTASSSRLALGLAGPTRKKMIDNLEKQLAELEKKNVELRLKVSQELETISVLASGDPVLRDLSNEIKRELNFS